MLAVCGEAGDISFRFFFAMAVPAHHSLELGIEPLGDGMVFLKAENVRLAAIEAASRVSQLLSAHFDAPGSSDWIRVLHALTSGLT